LEGDDVALTVSYVFKVELSDLCILEQKFADDAIWSMIVGSESM
jgi:hypothetical protein